MLNPPSSELDAEPIPLPSREFRVLLDSDWTRNAVLLISIVILLLLCTRLLAADPPFKSIPAMIEFYFAMITLMAVWALLMYRIRFRPVLITIGDEGLTDCGLIGAIGFIPWTDVRNVCVRRRKWQPSAVTESVYVEVFDEKALIARQSFLTRLWRNYSRMFGDNGIFLFGAASANVPANQFVEECRLRMQR
jgi:hypothetical protein